MRKIFRFLQIFIFFLYAGSASLFASDGLNANGDFQIWNIVGVLAEVRSDLRLLGQTELRWGDNGNLLYFQYAEASCYYQPKTWFWIGPSYRQEWNYVINDTRPWSTVYSPFIDISLGNTFSGWNISTRNFLMYRVIVSDVFPNEFRYRNRIQLILPKVNYFPIWLYGSEEFFIDQHYGLTQNRLIAGAQYTRKDRFRTAIEYMYRNLKQFGNWSHQNVLNIRIHLEF